MALLQLNLNPSRKELRWFAALWFPAFWGLVGLLAWRRHLPYVPFIVWICAALLAVAGFLSPRIIRPVYLGMMRVTYPIGWVTSNLVLVVAWYAVITPTGWLMRLFHDPMRKIDSSVKSYWLNWEPSDRSSYFRQL